MIPLPEPNTITRPYRGLSVQEVGVPLTVTALTDHLMGREVYRRTEWLLLRRGGDTALVAVRKASYEPLFSPVVELRVLAGPDEVVWIEDPLVDVGNATGLARAASAHRRPGALAYAVQGRYEHVNVIWEPAPVRVVVTEVVPPEPPKLLEMARQAVQFDEDLPPVELLLHAVDIRDLAADHPAAEYLLPCRGSGVDLPAPVRFLDTRPPEREPWLLIGCERSMQLHRHFYGDEPPQVDICPRRRAAATSEAAPGAGSALLLTKCCLRERGVEWVPGGGSGLDADSSAPAVVVPWGANLDEVRQALRMLLGLGPVAGAAVDEAVAR